MLIIRVHPELLSREALADTPGNDKTFWHQRYRSITNLERHLHANGTRMQNARLIVSQVVLDTFARLKMSHPKASAEREREVQAIRGQLVS